VILPAQYTKPLSDNFPTDGDLVIRLAEIAWKSPEIPEGLQLDEWQKWLLRHMLERYPDDHEDKNLAGKLRYRQVVVSMGRQNGKSVIAALLGLYGILLHDRGANVISLASSIDQANIVYNRVRYAIKANDWLAKRFKKASETRGILTADESARYVVKPAKEGALQGQPISLCLFDELHLAKTGMWTAAVLGTTNYRNGIVIGITTAGDQNSETLIDLYKSGQKSAQGDPELERFGFFLWTAPENAKIDDPEAIKAANPSVECGRIPLEQVLTDLKTLPEHEARRYRLNQFISGTAQSWLPGDIFRKSAGNGVKDLQGGVFAVDISRNWEHATIAYANNNGDKIETELVQSYVNPTEQQIFNRLLELFEKYQPRAIALDDRQLTSLGKRLKLQGIPTWQLWTKEVSAACSTVYALFSTDRVRHNNDPLLVTQMPNGIPKYTGETWLISRKESLGDIDALMATIFAIYVCNQAQKPEIGVF
jgi:phage terminase large subunit-like protein